MNLVPGRGRNLVPGRDGPVRLRARGRVAVLVSGRGSNLLALIAAASDPAYPAEIALVVSNKADAPALALARDAGIETVAIDHIAFHGDRAAHEAAIDAALASHDIGFVCLAGYMRRLSPFLVGAWAGRMINIHPSLLPSFPGLDTHRRALAAGVALHGCTVHLVTDGVDEGPILGQAAVPVLADDTEERLAARVLAAEHALLPSVLAAMMGAPPASASSGTRLIGMDRARLQFDTRRATVSG